MADQKAFVKGDSVTYTPSHGHPEKGVVKKVHPDGDKSWVVYNCGGEWHKYENYTAALTSHVDLVKGWWQ